jgi:hypothetical protein
MITAKICRPVQRADKRSQVPREPGDPVPLLARVFNPSIIGHDRSLSPRSERRRQ